MTVTESTLAAPNIDLASHFAASGGTFTDSNSYAVPNGSAAVIVYGNNSFSTSDISAASVSDVGGHTWTRLTPTYDQVNMPFIVSYWKNTTGSSVNITPKITQTFTNNQEAGYSVHLISGDDGTPSVITTVDTGATGVTTDIEASGTPTSTGSRFCLHYIHQTASAIASSFVTGTTVDTSPAGSALTGTGTNALGLGTLYQSATNSQTSSPVTVGAAAPTDGYLFAVLVEYQSSGGGGGGFTGVRATAAAAGIPGAFLGSLPGSFTGVRGTAAAAGHAGTFSGGSAPQPVTETTIRTASITYASNFAASGATSSLGTFTVPAGASIVAVSGANNSNVTALAIADAAGHTWRRLVGYNASTMPLAVDMWHNDTGATQLIAVQFTPTYSNNKTIGIAVYVIANCGASPVVKGTLTGSTTTPDLSATPTVVGSLLVLHYVQQQPSAIASAFETGTTGDTTAGGYGVGNSGTDKMGIGTLYQTTPNTQTSSPVAVGATAPSATTYAALIEYLPSASSTGQGFAGKNGHATAAGIPGLFQGTLFVGALAHAAATGAPGTFEGTTIISGPLATATAHGIPGTFTGTVFQSGAFPGAVGRVAAPGIPGVFTAGDLWTGATGTATARGIPGTFSSNVTPTRNITITIGLITGSWSGAAPIGGWTSGVDQISGWAVGTAESGWSAGGITG